MANLVALRSALRAAIVIPAVFAIADEVIAKPQTSILAAFGSFALLVLVEFSGPPRARLLAYLGLGCVGALFVVLGTLCSRSAWLAAVAMAAVGFATLLSGVFGGYFAAASTGAIVTFVLPVTLRVRNGAIPDRLEGWGLATGAAILAAMLIWPSRPRANERRLAAVALREVADLVEASGDQAQPDRSDRARRAVDELRRRLLGSQHRPSGPTGPTLGLASLPEELDWLLSFLVSPTGAPPLEPACAEDREAIAATAAILRAGAERLEGLTPDPDFARLDRAREAVARAVVRRLSHLPKAADDDALTRALDPPFRIRVSSYSARQIAAYAMLATGEDAPEPDRGEPSAAARVRSAAEATERFAAEHAATGSIWFQNSLRGAAGLAVAVYIAQRTGVQHGFWVVLGTLSVLRSNALGTGWSIVSALAGTAAGLVAGSLLVIGIGTHELVLWLVLPLAILLAAYAPRAISFAAGQAGFTVVLLVLYNIIQPVGWRVGLVRIEDVSIGFAISLGVGLLFWPRGAAALLRRDLAAAYARAAESVVATVQVLTAGAPLEEATRAGRVADTAIHRLDDAFRQYLSERSASRLEIEDVAAFVGGASRVRRAAVSLTVLVRMGGGEVHLDGCGNHLDGELHAFQTWYIAFGYALANGSPVHPPHIRDVEGHRRLLECIRERVGGGDPSAVHAAVVLLWASQHLDNLWRLEGHLGRRGALAVRAPEARLGALRRLTAPRTDRGPSLPGSNA